MKSTKRKDYTGVVNGDCYQTVGHFAMYLKWFPELTDNWRVVHGIVCGDGGQAKDIEFGHAWMELDEDFETRLVHDYSNDREIIMLASDYYSRGRIIPDKMKRYTIKEILTLMVDTGHFGPWDDLFKNYL